LFIVVPCKRYTTIEIALPIFNNLVRLYPKGSKEVLEMFVTNIFDAKVVHAQVEPDGSWSVFPEARHVGLFEVSMACQKWGLRSLLAKMLACGSPYIPFLISM
jgi:hypothetical protein